MKLSRVLLVSAGCLLAGSLALELGLRRFVLPKYWRPLPPFQALMTPTQREWLAREKEELAGRAVPEGIRCFDAELGWCYRPGSRDPTGEYTIHAGGWRGPRDYASEPPAGVTRIAAFGESFTFCHEVADDATWSARLEALDPELEVINMGVGGYGTDQALLRAERELPRLKADLVFVGLLLENIGRNVTRYRPLWVPESGAPVAKPRFVLKDGALELVPLPFRGRAEFLEALESGTVLDLLEEHEFWSREPLPGWLAHSAVARLFYARVAYARRDIRRQWMEPGEPFAVTLALLARFRTLAREHGARDAVVLIFPARPDLAERIEGRGKYWTPLLSALADAPHLDLSDALAAATRDMRPGPLYGEGHFSERGNEVVARAVLDWLAGRR